MKTVCLATFLLLTTLAVTPVAANSATVQSSIPHIVELDGRYALFVDGAPYLILGAQINNSSSWPAMLPKVWPAISYIHANTVEMPVYWEQIEPKQGSFDFSVVDSLLSQARRHDVHVILLWFGTWKNGSSHYMPLWMKAEPTLYPRMTGKNGRPVDSPSPFAAATLQADKAAFVSLMGHLKEIDRQHTVIMVQVENETGTWGSVRDYSPAAQELFAGPVPAKLLAALHLAPTAGADNWQAVFGDDAEVFFHAWSIAGYVGQVAAAGKAVYPLPMYVNASLRDPINPSPPGSYESGGPTDNVIPIWKAAAPAIDMCCPDIYMSDGARYEKVLELYSRPDNPLYVPETGSGAAYARYFFAALGHGSIGFSPFGIDYTSARRGTYDDAAIADWLGPIQMDYEVFGPMEREIARLNWEGKIRAVSEQDATPVETLNFGAWNAIVSYGEPGFGRGAPHGNPDPIGGAMIAQLGRDKFLVTGFHCKVDFHASDPSSTKQRQLLRVDEGTYQGGVFIPIRIWNGDQTDFGLSFYSQPQVLRVLLGTY